MKSLDLQNTNDLMRLREEIDKILSARILESQKADAINSVDDIPFGTVKALFESVSDKLFSTAKGKSLIGKYIKSIKENKSLCKEYAFYNLIRHPQAITDVTSYIMEAKKLCDGVDSEKCQKAENKVKSIVKECLKETNASVEDINDVISHNLINEDANFILKNKPNFDNIGHWCGHMENLKTFVVENQPNTVVNENSGKSVKELVSELEAMFSGNLNEWENRVVRDISLANISNADKKELFENYKNECISAMDERLKNSEIEDKSQIFAMKTQLESKEYNAETIVEDLLKFSELKNIIVED